jgi:hypothetical protein
MYASTNALAGMFIAIALELGRFKHSRLDQGGTGIGKKRPGADYYFSANNARLNYRHTSKNSNKILSVRVKGAPGSEKKTRGRFWM